MAICLHSLELLPVGGGNGKKMEEPVRSHDPCHYEDFITAPHIVIRLPAIRSALPSDLGTFELKDSI